MPELRLRFIADSGFVSKAIQYVTFSEWSHVELITEAGTYIGAHDTGGVEERAADYCAPSRERRYAIPVTQMQYDAAMAFAKSKIGTPYDFRDILGLFLHYDLSTSGHLICSWFIFQWLMAGGIHPLNVLPGFGNLVSPETLHLSPYLIGRAYYSSPAKS